VEPFVILFDSPCLILFSRFLIWFLSECKFSVWTEQSRFKNMLWNNGKYIFILRHPYLLHMDTCRNLLEMYSRTNDQLVHLGGKARIFFKNLPFFVWQYKLIQVENNMKVSKCPLLIPLSCFFNYLSELLL